MTEIIPKTDKTLECIVDGCTNLRRTRDLCGTHYNVLMSGRDPHNYVKRPKGRGIQTDENTRKRACTKCGEVKTRQHFYEREGGKLYPSCKDCHYLATEATRIRNRDEKRAQRAAQKAAKVAEPIKTCNGPECVKPVEVPGYGLCKSHWQQQHVGKELTVLRGYHAPGSTLVGTSYKRCIGCDEVKHVRNFYLRSNGKTRQPTCRQCTILVAAFNQALRNRRFDAAKDKLNEMREPQKSKYQARLSSILEQEGGLDNVN